MAPFLTCNLKKSLQLKERNKFRTHDNTQTDKTVFGMNCPTAAPAGVRAQNVCLKELHWAPWWRACPPRSVGGGVHGRASSGDHSQPVCSWGKRAVRRGPWRHPVSGKVIKIRLAINLTETEVPAKPDSKLKLKKKAVLLKLLKKHFPQAKISLGATFSMSATHTFQAGRHSTLTSPGNDFAVSTSCN